MDRTVWGVGGCRMGLVMGCLVGLCAAAAGCRGLAADLDAAVEDGGDADTGASSPGPGDGGGEADASSPAADAGQGREAGADGSGADAGADGSTTGGADAGDATTGEDAGDASAASDASVPCGDCDGFCVDGRCVACRTAADCSAPACQSATCESGSCRSSSAPEGVGCGVANICNGSGLCVECNDHDDCVELGKGRRCVQPGTGDSRCVECAPSTAADDCETTQLCRAATCSGEGICGEKLVRSGSCGTGMVCNDVAECVVACGNGTRESWEECDPLAEPGVCSDSCEYRDWLAPCGPGTGCSGGLVCSSDVDYGNCMERCDVTSDCPQTSPPGRYWCSDGYCRLGCSTQADCPDANPISGTSYDCVSGYCGIAF